VVWSASDSDDAPFEPGFNAMLYDVNQPRDYTTRHPSDSLEFKFILAVLTFVRRARIRSGGV